MAETKMIRRRKPKDVATRNLILTEHVTRYFLNHPEVLDSLPDNFELVLLPEDDPEMSQYNLNLLNKYSRQDKPIVFARLPLSGGTDLEIRPSLYIPLAV